jgi:uncharacterized protein
LRRFAILFLLLLVPTPAPAADGESSGGTFTVHAGGRPAGEEVWRRTAVNGTLVLSSRASLKRADREQELELSFSVSADDRTLREFSARGVVGERERVVTLAASDGALVGEIREGEVSRGIRCPREVGAIVLAEPFAAPWIEVATRYDLRKGGRQVFPAVYPLEGETGQVVVARREEEALQIDGAALLTTRLLATPDRGSPANLWIDGDGELVVCARSVAGISAVRGRTLKMGLKPGEDPLVPEGLTVFRVRIASGEGTLGGSLMVPESRPSRSPAVLLLSGSGPQDRNGNAPGSELCWNYLTSFAEALSRRKMITLRYDDRGVAGSSGSFVDAGLTDFRNDAASALAYLKSREDVDPERVAVLGHSEGALLGAMLAPQGLAAIVLVGAPAEPLDRILLAQIRSRTEERGTDADEARRILADLRAYFEHVRLSTADVLDYGGQVKSVRWLREHLSVDPLSLYAAISCPVLVVHGERDMQVPVEHGRRIALSLRTPGRRLLRLPGLDHFLMPTPGGLETYGDARRRVAAVALQEVGDWLATRLAK